MNDIEELKNHYENLGVWNADQTTSMIDILRKVKKNEEYKDEELVDLGFFLREMEKLADEIRKDCKAKKELIGRILCMRIVHAATEDPNRDLVVKAEYSSGTADIAKAPGIPKYGTEGYEKLCNHFGLTKETIDKGVLHFHFTRLGEYITELAAEGKEPPPGIGKVYDIYRTNWRKKRSS